MDFEDSNLHERNQARQRVDVEVTRRRLAFGCGNGVDVIAKIVFGVPLIKALPAGTAGTTDESEQPLFNMWHDPLRDALVIQPKLALGDALFRIEHPVRVGEGNASDSAQLARMSFDLRF